ncbi:Histone acetyltransferase [Coemansia sp. S146]|nr:Histone acetyltransferase [Coemansia sp. S146]
MTKTTSATATATAAAAQAPTEKPDAASATPVKPRRGRPPKSATKAAAGSTEADAGTTLEPAAKRRRTYTKKAKAAESSVSLELDERVFFSNRLSAQEADTTQFVPGDEDRSMFEEARAAACLTEGGAAAEGGGTTPSTPSAVAGMVGYQVKKIRFGSYIIDSWYISPFPDEYSRHALLYICEYCLKYMKSEYTFKRHCQKCTQRHPPGDEIYRDDNVSVFEVDGRKNKIYCQNLCLIGKMYLDTKTLFYDVEPFLFYILCEYDSQGYHFAGYYSKEKRSSMGYNLSCIMILPSKQREGYGKLLIEFSYLLSKKEGVPGSPEKPLSDFGLLSYRSYWRRAIYEILLARGGATVSIDDLAGQTGMTVDDIISTLQTDGMLHRLPGSPGSYAIVADAKKTEEYVSKAREKNPRRIDPSKLRWAPFLIKATLDAAPADRRLSTSTAAAIGGTHVNVTSDNDDDDE